MYVLWSSHGRYLASITFVPGGTVRNFVSDPEVAMKFEDKSACYSMLLTMAFSGVETYDFEIHEFI